MELFSNIVHYHVFCALHNSNLAHLLHWPRRFCEVLDHSFCLGRTPPSFLVFGDTHLSRSLPESEQGIDLACLLGSCLLLLVLGDIILMKSYYRGNEFAANDCQSFGAKRDLEMQYQNAKMFYSQCVTGMSNKTGVSLQAAVSVYRIEDCFGYTAQLRTNPGWTYLGRLENEYSCGGWCAQDQPLWTLKIVKDSCSSAVADIMKDKVVWSMTQVVIYSLIVFGFVAALLLTVSPFFPEIWDWVVMC